MIEAAPRSIVRRVARYVRTVRHLRPRQVLGRLIAPIRRRTSRVGLPDPRGRPAPSLRRRTGFPTHDPWNRREELLRGRFTFLGRSVDLGRPVDWHPSSVSLLWRFNLHYFQFLHLLDPGERHVFCREWIRENPSGAGAGWHPYVTSRRIVSWCRGRIAEADCLESLFRQIAYLYRNVETHVCGNHLLENARALVVGGAYFRGCPRADRWLDRGLSIFREERSEQILADGFHFERSPMYQALVLEAHLDALNVLGEQHPDRSWLEDAAGDLAGALAGMVHPDGGLALLNDTTLEIAPSPEELMDYARTLLGGEVNQQSEFPAAGYYTFRDRDLWLVVDAGAGGPDHLMAHAHADVFSYELSVGGFRFIVDSGVFQYAGGTMRSYVRSTRAHNTVEIDDADQFDCWDSFRVARRARPEQVSWQEEQGWASFEGVYRGYRTVRGLPADHARSMRIGGAERCIRVRDRIRGEGAHRVVSRIHLHPSVDVRRDGGEILLRREDVRCTIRCENEEPRLEEGWYCPEFGVRKRNPVIVLGGARALPVELSYRIDY